LLQDLENEALRIRKIVQNMLRLAQRQSGHDTTPVDLARTLDDAVELCGPSDMAAAGISVVRKYGATPAVRGSATQLQESFIQIIQNARSAMKKGGTLTLETSQIEDKVVRLRISDTGTGISAEHLPRIFDPFFTTKGDRSGTGLGLSFVHRTVEDHGGAVTVDSSVGGGTTFTLTFPADEGRAHRP
jgi:signal transduction histidine kinase